jgi:hypothetical protein
MSSCITSEEKRREEKRREEKRLKERAIVRDTTFGGGKTLYLRL